MSQHILILIACIVIGVPVAVLWTRFTFETQLHLLIVATMLSLWIPHLHDVDVASLLVLLTCLQRVRLREFTTATGILLLLVIWTVISMAWSPAKSGARTDLIYFVVTGGTLMCGALIARSKVSIEPFIRTWCLVSLLQSGSTILFRLDHGLALSYLKSGIAKIFIGQVSVSTLFTTGYNNVLSPSKSGGFFYVDANPGSVVCGVGAVLCLYLARTTKQPLWWVAVAINVIAAVASGSDTAYLLLVVAPILLFFLSKRRQLARILIPAVAMAVVLALFLIAHQGHNTTSPLGSRFWLWSQARTIILQNPLKGLGYGGWLIHERSLFVPVGLRATPPQNLLLEEWLAAGIVGLLLMMWFFARVWRVTTSSEASPLYKYIAVAFAWTFIHSMGDNTSILSDAHVAIILGLLIGFTEVTTDDAVEPATPTSEIPGRLSARRLIRMAQP
jgi:O-antigen ligase